MMHQPAPARVLILSICLLTAATMSLALSAADNAANPPDRGYAPTTRPQLRKPGFLFLELQTPGVDEYVKFFERVTEFKVVSTKPRYVEMESTCGQLIVMDPAELPKGHPFYGRADDKNKGSCTEIGIVVADLDKSFAAAVSAKQFGFRISSGIAKRPWGARDFRVLAPDGFYLRFTEGGN